MYLAGIVNNVEATFTIDTGASCSLLAKHIFQQIPEENQPSLQKANIRITGADGMKIDCLGVGTFIIDFGSGLIEQPLMVADITDDVLLRADIIEMESMDLILSKDILLHHDVSRVTIKGHDIFKEKYNTLKTCV